MTKLSMHERLPFDEATTPPRVSTGELPQARRRRARWSPRPTSATGRTRTVSSPTTSPPWPRASPDLFGICVAGARGRSFEIGDVDTLFSIQSVSKPFVFALVCEEVGLRGRPPPARCEQHRLPVQLADGGRAERRPHDEPVGQRRCDRDDEPGAGRHGRAEVRTDPRRALALRRPRAEHERGRLRLRGRFQHAQPGHRAPAWRATAGCTSIPTRPPTSTPASARST